MVKEYDIKDIEVGQSEEFSIEITNDMMEVFFKLTQDENPLHSDAEFAKKKGFRDRVVYGMLTAAFISTMGGCYIPGKQCIIQGVDLKFVHPVYVGDVLSFVGTVSAVYVELNRIDVKLSVKNQLGVQVMKGKLKAGVLNE